MRTNRNKPFDELFPGPPVNWDRCIVCLFPMLPDEDRYRIEKDGEIGIGHKECAK